MIPPQPPQPQVPQEPPKTLGTIEDLHKKCRDILPTPFEGARFILNKTLSNHFQVYHNLTMSQQMSGYKFGCAYAGSNMLSSGEAYPLLIGDIDPSGNMSANIITRFHPKLISTLKTQIHDNKCAGLQIGNEFRTEKSSTTLTLVNPDPLEMSGISILQYLQQASPTIDLGAEMVIQSGRMVPGGIISALSLCGRYTSPSNYIFSAELKRQSVNMCYYQKCNDNLKIGIELETNMKLKESICTVGYQVELPHAGTTFKASLDSNFSVAGVIEKKLNPLPFTLSLSGFAAMQNMYKFGIGMTLG